MNIRSEHRPEVDSRPSERTQDRSRVGAQKETSASDATLRAISQRPLSRAYRPFIGPTLKVPFGPMLPVRALGRKGPLLLEPNDWRHCEGVVQTATVTAASRRTIAAFWPGKIHAKPVADGSLALGRAKS